MQDVLNRIAEHWFDWQVAMLWQTAVLIGIIWIVDVLIRKWAHPQVRYALWMLVLVKLLIPPTWTSSASVTSHIPDLANRAATVMERAETQNPATPAIQVSNGDKDISQNFQRGQDARVPLLTSDAEISTNRAVTVMERTEDVPRIENRIAGDESPGTDALSTPTPTAAEQTKFFLHWQVYAMLTWLAGMIVLSAWLILRLSGLRREHLKSSQNNVLPKRFYRQLEETAAKLRLKHLPRVILTGKVACPAVFGVFRPVLLMPAEKFKSMSRQDTEHILLHELAHIKRGDLLVHTVWMCVQIVYWFNPLLWMVRRPLQNLRELCCDATVARLLRDQTYRYRETLLETARQLLAEPVDPGLGLLGLFENNNWLLTRLQWLEKNTWKNRPLRIAIIIALVAVMTACVLPMANRPRNPELSSQKTKYTITLGNGVTVELLGVCQHPSERKQWWSPDGPFLDESPFDYQEGDRVYAYGDDRAYDFAVRYTNIAEDMDSIFYAEPSASSLGGTLSSDVKKNGKSLQNYQNGRLISTVSHLATVFDKNRKTCDIKIGIADEPWVTYFKSVRSKTDGNWGQSGQGRSEGGAIFGTPTEEKQKTSMTITHTFNRKVYDLRVVAVHQDGSLLKPIRSSGNSVGEATQLTLLFDLPLEYITAFQVQMRKYEWYEFKDVSLRPAGDEYDVTGTVTDAETGEPIAGVEVFDDGYNDSKFRTTTNKSGRFTLFTAKEEHNVSAKADGYEKQTKLLKTFPFANNKNFDFQLSKLPLPELVAHQYYKEGEPIKVRMDRVSIDFKPTLDELYDDDREHIFVIINGEEYGSRLGTGPFGSGVADLTINDITYERTEFPPGRYRFAYGWKDLDVIDPDKPDEPMHFDRLITNEVEFEVVDELPSDYFEAVYQDGWDEILDANIEPWFTDDFRSVGVAGTLLGIKVGPLPFDVAFDVYAQSEDMPEPEYACQLARSADSKGFYSRWIQMPSLTWDNAGEQRWRIILKPSQKAAAEHPPIRYYYDREYTTGWLTFEKSELFDQHRERFGESESSELKVNDSMTVLSQEELTRENFFTAVREGNLPRVKQFVARGFDVNTTSVGGPSALHEAGPWGQTEIARFLIEHGADMHLQDSRRRTPLIAAAAYSHQAEPTAKLLIENGANVTLPDDRGMTPLHYACTASMCQMLVEEGADIHARDDRGWTPLHYDSNWERLSAVQYLVENGADIDAVDNEGRTPLMLASTNACTPVVEYLIKQGASLSVTDTQGRTPLHCAVLKNENQIRERLNGERAGNGRSQAAFDEHRLKIIDTIKLMVAAVSDLQAKDAQGLTALDYARATNNSAAVKLLSADVNILNSELQTGSYSAVLPNGITVSLLGVADIPADGQWWAADGTPMDTVYWEGTTRTNEEAKDARQVVLRIDSPETDPDAKPTMTVSVKRHSVSEGAGAFIGTFIVDKDRQSLEDHAGCSFSLHDDYPTVDVPVTVSYGPWQTLTTKDADEQGNLTSHLTNAGTVVFNDPVEKDGKTILSLTLLAQIKTSRIIAIDRQGKTHTGSVYSMGDRGDENRPAYQIFKAEFHVPLSEIDKFEFQTRKTQKVTFKNVALNSGGETDIKVVIGGGGSVTDEKPESPSGSSTKTKNTEVPYDVIIERTLSFRGIFDVDLFDFRTNTVFEIPEKLKFSEYPKWYAEQGIDVGCTRLENGPTLSGNGRISGSFGNYGGNLCKFIETDLELDSSAEDLGNAWQRGESVEAIEHGGWDNLPRRFFFRSRDGDNGILEIISIDENEGSIHFKYKLFETKQETQNSELPTQNYKATLPNGVTVELLGVCEHPSDGKQWWRPNGSWLKERPYDDDDGRAFPKDDQKGYKLAIRISNMAGKEIDAYVVPRESKSTNGGKLFSTSEKNGKENIKYVDGQLDEKVIWQGVVFNEMLSRCDVRVGVCWGKWKNEYKYENDRPDDAVEWVTFKNVALRPGGEREKVSPSQRPEFQPYYLADNPEFWNSNLGKSVVVKGVTVNTKMGAGLKSEYGTVWIDGLTHWPTDALFKIVRVTGTVLKRHDGPQLSREQLASMQTNPVQGTLPPDRVDYPEGSKELYEARKRYLLKDIDYAVIDSSAVQNNEEDVALRHGGEREGKPEAGTMGSPKEKGVTLRPYTSLKHEDRAHQVQFMPDSLRILSYSVKDDLKISEIMTGKLLNHLSFDGYSINSMTLSKDGLLLAVGTNTGKVKLWDMQSLKLRKTFPVTKWSIYALALSDDGKVLGSCAADGTIQLWDIESGKKLHSLGQKGDRMISMAFSKDGQSIAALSRSGKLSAWNTSNGLLIDSTHIKRISEIGEIRFCPDNNSIVIAAPDGIRFWVPLADGVMPWIKLPDSIDPEKKMRPIPDFGGPIYMGMTVLSPDCSTAATVIEDGTIVLWDIQSRAIRCKLVGARVPDLAGGGIDTVTFSDNMRLLASGNRNGTVEIYQLPPDLSLRPGGQTEVEIETQSPVSRPQSSGWKELTLPDVDETPVMLDLASGELVKVPEYKGGAEGWLAALDKLDKGDMIFDANASPGLTFLRGADCNHSISHPGGFPVPIYKISEDENLPETIIVTNGSGEEYKLEILSVDKQGCKIRYKSLRPGGETEGEIETQSSVFSPQSSGEKTKKKAWPRESQLVLLSKYCVIDIKDEFEEVFENHSVLSDLGSCSYQVHLSLDGIDKVSIHYEKNFISGNKSTPASAKDKSMPYCSVRVELTPDWGQSSQLDYTLAQEKIQWDGEATMRGVILKPGLIRATVKVETDDESSRKAINSIIDNQLNRLFKIVSAKDSNVALRPGEEREVQNKVDKQKVYLPDLESKDAKTVLDLTSGQMLSAEVEFWKSESPGGYPEDYISMTAQEQYKLAVAYSALMKLDDSITPQDNISKYQEVIDRFPNSKYAMESYHNIIYIDQLRTDENCRQIVAKWPDVVTDVTRFARSQVQSRYDYYHWLKSITDKQMENGVRNYSIRGGPSEDVRQEQIENLKGIISREIQSIEQDPSFHPDRDVKEFTAIITESQPIDLDNSQRRWEGNGKPVWPLPQGFDIGFTPAAIRIDLDSDVRMLPFGDFGSPEQPTSQMFDALSELDNSYQPITGINRGWDGTIVAIRSSKGRVYYVRAVRYDRMNQAKVTWWEVENPPSSDVNKYKKPGEEPSPTLKIVDKETGKPIPNCGFTFSGWGRGQKTNLAGIYNKPKDGFSERLKAGSRLIIKHPFYKSARLENYQMDENQTVTVLLEKEGTATLRINVKVIVRGEEADAGGTIRLFSVDNNNVVRKLFNRSIGHPFVFSGLKEGPYRIETNFEGAYPHCYKEIQLKKGEHKQVEVVVETDQLARILVAGKLLNKRTGEGIEGGTLHFVGAPSDDGVTDKDGLFSTQADRSRFSQTLLWLNEASGREGQTWSLSLDDRVDEKIASNLQIHIDPETVLQMNKPLELRDDNGDGVFCDGVDCTICE